MRYKTFGAFFHAETQTTQSLFIINLQKNISCNSTVRKVLVLRSDSGKIHEAVAKSICVTFSRGFAEA